MAKARTVPNFRAAAAFYQSGRLRDAEAVCRQIVKTDRKHFDALHMLGVIAGKSNRFDDAIALFNRALKARPGSVVIHCAIGRIHSMQAAYEKSIAAYDRALKQEPDSAVAIAGKAQTLTRRGDFDAARALLEPHVDAERENAEMAFVFVETLEKSKEHARSVELLTRHLSDPKTDNINRRRLSYALGRAYAKLDDYDRSFDAFRNANEIAVQPFEIIKARRGYDRIIAHFTAERMAELPRARNDSELPIFIVGMPRCGSTLTEQIIAAHPLAHGAGEITDLAELVRGIPEELKLKLLFPDYVNRMDVTTLDRFANRHLGRLRQFDRNADRIIDKHLESFKFLGMIEMLFPNARIIHCRRDPMSVCFSIYTLGLSEVQHPYSTDLRNLGLYYREYERLMEHWRSVLNIRMLDVQYEELVQDQEQQSRAIIDFCGLEWDDACLRFHETGRAVATASVDQVRQPMYTTATKRYEAYDRHLGPLKESLGIAG